MASVLPPQQAPLAQPRLQALVVYTEPPLTHSLTELPSQVGGLLGSQVRQLPPTQSFAAPQDFPSATLPASVQTALPDPHATFPVLQGFAGVQIASAVHAPHVPLLHTMFVPQALPFAALLPASVHVAVPLLQDRMPTWHLFSGTQGVPSLQAAHAPSWQTFPVPQLFPLGALPEAAQTEEPDAQSVWPTLHGSGGSHALFAAQLPHWPDELQTMSTPQAVPGATSLLVSVHFVVPPAQSSVPT
jgi:hypothetical protein